MKFLIIYNLVPENLQLHTLSTDDPVLIAAAQSSHGKMVGLVGEPEDLVDNINKVLAASVLIYDYQVNQGNATEMRVGTDCRVIVTGQII